MAPVLAIYHYFIALLAIAFYRYPAGQICVIAVTGTSGKTTTTHLIYEILKKAGKKISLISTITAVIGNKKSDIGLHVTTPSPFLLQKLIREAVNQGSQYIVIEASSHGIAQFRMLGTNVKIGVLTNIAHEHLDWHKTFENYVNAKLSLILNSKIAVVNKDDESYNFILKRKSKAELITYSIETDADFSSNDLPQNTILPGAYNRQNMLAAYAVSEILQIDRKVSSKTISEFQGLRGRFEYVENNRGFKIIVDFAHKPNAFDAVLDTMRLMNKQGRLIIMFGSAGERDKLKRPMMGEIAGAKADISVITAEDPRSEDVNDINESISKGLIKSGAKEFKKTVYEFDNNKYFIRIPDRKEAIDTIINKIAQPGDIIAFLGKSHEKSMCYGKKEYPWNEFEEIKKALDAN